MVCRVVTLFVVPLAVAAVASLSAQSREGTPPRLAPAVKLQAGETAVPGECLTREELDLNKALAALTRPTRGVEAGADADDVPRFNPNYFVGKWTIEGVLPESPLGPAGDLTGTETIRHVDGCTYEGTLQAKSAGGAFSVKTLNVYDRRANYFVRLEQDSRGFQLLKPGAFGGDSGGYFNHHWDATEFLYKGKRVRLTGTTFLASPDRQRVRMQISVDGQPFANFGTLWWTREGASRE
jgi:hypothetical protein